MMVVGVATVSLCLRDIGQCHGVVGSHHPYCMHITRYIWTRGREDMHVCCFSTFCIYLDRANCLLLPLFYSPWDENIIDKSVKNTSSYRHEHTENLC